MVPQLKPVGSRLYHDQGRHVYVREARHGRRGPGLQEREASVTCWRRRPWESSLASSRRSKIRTWDQPRSKRWAIPISATLSGIVSQLQQGGLDKQVQSWLESDKNLPVTVDQLRGALSDQHVQQIARELGLPVDSALQFLAQHLRAAVTKPARTERFSRPSRAARDRNAGRSTFLLRGAFHSLREPGNAACPVVESTQLGSRMVAPSR